MKKNPARFGQKFILLSLALALHNVNGMALAIVCYAMAGILV